MQKGVTFGRAMRSHLDGARPPRLTNRSHTHALACLLQDPIDSQTWIIIYHAYVRPATSGARALMMDTLRFDADGWPQLTTGTGSPSTTPTPLPPVAPAVAPAAAVLVAGVEAYTFAAPVLQEQHSGKLPEGWVAAGPASPDAPVHMIIAVTYPKAAVAALETEVRTLAKRSVDPN